MKLVQTAIANVGMYAHLYLLNFRLLVSVDVIDTVQACRNLQLW